MTPVDTPCHSHPSICRTQGGHNMHKINETFVKKAAAPSKGNKIYYDSAHNGFGLRVTKAGTKSFILNYHINKRERRHTIGKHPIWSAAAARENANQLRRMIDQGIDPLEERIERHNAPTVNDLWAEYEKIHFPTLSPKSQVDQRGMWINHILPSLGQVAVRELNSSQIDRLHARISILAPPCVQT